MFHKDMEVPTVKFKPKVLTKTRKPSIAFCLDHILTINRMKSLHFRPSTTKILMKATKLIDYFIWVITRNGNGRLQGFSVNVIWSFLIIVFKFFLNRL